MKRYSIMKEVEDVSKMVETRKGRFIQALQNKTIDGYNYNSKGLRRNWLANATGIAKFGTYEKLLIQVVEFERAILGDKVERWLNLDTFTGTVDSYVFNHGVEVREIKREVVHEHDSRVLSGS
jgi:hypothetical protein